MAIGVFDFIGVFMFKELLSNFKDNKENKDFLQYELETSRNNAIITKIKADCLSKPKKHEKAEEIN